MKQNQLVNDETLLVVQAAEAETTWEPELDEDEWVTAFDEWITTVEAWRTAAMQRYMSIDEADEEIDD